MQKILCVGDHQQITQLTKDKRHNKLSLCSPDSKARQHTNANGGCAQEANNWYQD